ncbi:MAG TPA: HAD family hydrolase [Candidatus Paceibacterota bacterium]|nr:HAD family hydrolase [Verrucomicrobiota bacterium]HRY51041.1 HAD family hydrolase [Candidatus Paceibacterota bacterium]HSA02027.1 HAD family hydrolase [Candidatus Paceibacterota bacterium]
MNPTSDVGGVPAVFLDRDGTLIEDRGSLRSPAQVVFYEETVPSLRRLQKGFRLFIVTNQSGVGKGELTLEEARWVNAHVVERLREHGVDILAVYCCPHQRSDHCACIKPLPHFLLQAARDYRLDLGRSFVIGDHPHDVELARNAGATGIYLLTGHGRKHQTELSGNVIVTANIQAAADWILTGTGAVGIPLLSTKEVGRSNPM